MVTAILDNPVPARFHAALDAAYGSRLDRVVLYGSRARGQKRPEAFEAAPRFLATIPALLDAGS